MTVEATTRVYVPLGPWARHANCTDMDTDDFYPETGNVPTRAMKACAACVVRHQCLEHALDHGELYGVWGGTTPEQRRRLRKARRVA